MSLLLLVVLLIGPGWAVDVQPQACPLCVTTTPGAASLFGRAAQNGTVGILAHNDLAGAQFYALRAGDTLELVHQDGGRMAYSVTGASAYYRSRGRLCGAAGCYTEDEVFAREYSGGLVLQTCIGDNQGLYFVHAERVKRPRAWVSYTPAMNERW